MKKNFKLYKYMTEREVRLQKIAERMRKRYRKKFIKRYSIPFLIVMIILLVIWGVFICLVVGII